MLRNGTTGRLTWNKAFLLLLWPSQILIEEEEGDMVLEGDDAKSMLLSVRSYT